MKYRKPSDVEGPPTHSLDVSCQAAAVASSSSTQESKEIPVHGFFTLKTVASKVMYCVTFLKNCCLVLNTWSRDKIVPSTSKNLNQCQAPLQRQTTRRPWTREEDATLRKMKKEGYSWEEIHAALPQRDGGGNKFTTNYIGKWMGSGSKLDELT
jgi:hypothetical protein